MVWWKDGEEGERGGRIEVVHQGLGLWERLFDGVWQSGVEV